VEDLEGKMDNTMTRTQNVEVVTTTLMDKQEKLHNKVAVLAFDWDVNLKYSFQVVKFETDMLNFSINNSLAIHHDRTVQERSIQEEFGIHQDQIAGLEERLHATMRRVSVS
jgi:hypothetical protein